MKTVGKTRAKPQFPNQCLFLDVMVRESQKLIQKTYLLLFITKAPTPTRCEAFAGIVSTVLGSQHTSIK